MATTSAIERPTAVSRFSVDNGNDSANVSSAPSPLMSQDNSSSSSISSVEKDGLDEKTVPIKSVKLINTYGDEFNLPDFTIKDIRDAIPKHCFERSAIRSGSYVLRDIVLLTTTFIAFNNYIVPALPNATARFFAWTLYTIMQGLFGTGIWIMAHECGHQAFSPSKTINDSVGWVLHSFLLVPYFSWKLSHGKHHKATGHMERDMVFVPKTRMQYAQRMGREIHELTEETPIATVIHMLGQQLFGWPAYILANVTGHNHHEKQTEGRGKGKKNGLFWGVNHLNPESPLFENKDAKLVLLSDLGLAIMGTILYVLSQKFGAANVMIWYGVPYLWVNHWLVAITFLQHTDPSLPHYDNTQWNFARGAAATIDREFGFIGRHLLHGIVEYHVVHHFISQIPFYHGEEATDAIRGVMGEHYREDRVGGPIGFLKSIWTSARWCQWVEESEGSEGSGVMFFRNRNGLGVPPRPI